MRGTGAAVAGVGYSRIVRRSSHTALKFALDAAVEAMADAGVVRSDIDGIVTCAAAPNRAARHDDGVDDVSMFILEEALGLKGLKFRLDTDLMSGSMVAAATHAIASGACRCVLIVKAHYNDSATRYSDQRIESIGGPPQFRLPYGLGLGMQRAFWLKRYMHDHGVRREDLYPIVRMARNHASKNPVAIWRERQVSLEEYAAAPWFCEPMSILDVDMPVCGAGALLMVSADMGRELGRPLAHVRACCMQDSIRDVLAENGLGAGRLPVAQIYDGYGMFILHWLEHLGICETGQAWKFIQDGAIELGGRLPLNTFGGSLGEGRLHGIGHLREGALQAMGRAGARQVESSGRHSLVQIGVPENSWCVLFAAEP